MYWPVITPGNLHLFTTFHMKATKFNIFELLNKVALCNFAYLKILKPLQTH